MRNAHGKRRYFWGRKLAPYAFISPFYLLFAVFGVFPILFSLYLSFHRWDIVSPMQWVGFENYKFLFEDEWFWMSLGNTIKLGIMGAVPQHLMALVLAFILNSGLLHYPNFFRTAFFMPYITSTVALTIIFGVIFGTRYGALNYALTPFRNFQWFQWFLNLFNLEFPIEWLGRAHTIRPTLALIAVWRWTGWNMILYLAGLQAIPQELYEAAKVDGARVRDLFFKISLPLLRPMIMFAVTMSVIGAMQAFDEPFVLLGSSGGVKQAGMTTVLYLYRTSFEWMDFGTGAAMSYLLFLFIILFSIINLRFFRREK